MATPITDAQRRFGFHTDHWNRPKPKILFAAAFQLNTQVPNISEADLTTLGQMVRTIDRPQYNHEVEIHNQYNRPRLVHGKLKYEPIRVIFYDDVNNSALRLYNQYRRFYYGDFQNKEDDKSWTYDTVAPTFENTANWGLSTLNNKDGEESYFFKQIDLYEFYGGQLTAYNLIHPKITAFEMDPRDITEEAISEVTITFEYEGVTQQADGVSGDAINQPIPSWLRIRGS